MPSQVKIIYWPNAQAFGVGHVAVAISDATHTSYQGRPESGYGSRDDLLLGKASATSADSLSLSSLTAGAGSLSASLTNLTGIQAPQAIPTQALAPRGKHLNDLNNDDYEGFTYISWCGLENFERSISPSMYDTEYITIYLSLLGIDYLKVIDVIVEKINLNYQSYNLFHNNCAHKTGEIINVIFDLLQRPAVINPEILKRSALRPRILVQHLLSFANQKFTLAAENCLQFDAKNLAQYIWDLLNQNYTRKILSKLTTRIYRATADITAYADLLATLQNLFMQQAEPSVLIHAVGSKLLELRLPAMEQEKLQRALRCLPS